MEQSLAEAPRDPLASAPGSQCFSPGLPGRRRGSVLPSGASSMRRAAAARGDAGGARRWLPWLGLCFWAAGAAAARGKRGVEREAEPGARRPSGTRTYGVGFPSCALHLSARSAQRGGTRAEDLRGDHCLPPQVRDQPQPYRLLGPGPLPFFSSRRLLYFPSPPQLLQTGVPTSSLQSRSPQSSLLPSVARSFTGGRP